MLLRPLMFREVVASERPQEETEDLIAAFTKAARIIDLTFDGRLSTGHSNISNVGSLQETRVEELNALQLE